MWGRCAAEWGGGAVGDSVKKKQASKRGTHLLIREEGGVSVRLNGMKMGHSNLK